MALLQRTGGTGFSFSRLRSPFSGSSTAPPSTSDSFPTVRVHLWVFLGFFVTRILPLGSLMLGYWFLLQLLGGTAGALQAQGGAIAFAAHVGGFLAGALLVSVFKNRVLLARREQLLSYQ